MGKTRMALTTSDLYYDYELQVWVFRGKVQCCAHPERMGDECCNGFKFAGLPIAQARTSAGLPALEERQ